MRSLTILTAGFLLLSLPSAAALGQHAEAWKALDAAVQHHEYPTRGRFMRLPAPDYAKQLRLLDGVLAKARGGPVEPIALYYRGNTLFFLERFSEALDVFRDLMKRFPNHGLCTIADQSTSPTARSLVADAIADCESEIETRKVYEVKPLPEAVLDDSTRVIFHTSLGDFAVALYSSASPQTVANFKKLAKSGFYNDTYVHRVKAMQTITLGCPNTRKDNRPRLDDGNGSPGYDLPLELNSATHMPGAVSMLRIPGTERSHGSQFTICITPQPDLDNVQAVFGQVVDGLDVVKRISQERADDQGNPYQSIWIKGVEIITSAKD